MHVTRQLRRDQTPWEAKLWSVLRNRKVEGLKFRRQFKIGKYVVDFYCLEKRLIIELDGGHHNETDKSALDLERQKYLETKGYKVLRFWNSELDNNLDGVIEVILRNSQPHPYPLPSGRGSHTQYAPDVYKKFYGNEN